MRRTRTLTLSVAALIAASGLTAATAESASATCVDVINIGVTVKDGNYAKGSGSYTSCGTIREVVLSIYSGTHVQRSESRSMTSGSASFSVVENCGTYQPLTTWHTTITAFNSRGEQWAMKTSNYKTFNC